MQVADWKLFVHYYSVRHTKAPLLFTELDNDS